MKICLLNDSFPPLIDGVANTVVNYAEILTKTFGDEVVVATPKYPHTNYDNYPYKVIAYQSIATEKIAGYRLGNSYSPEALFKIAAFSPDIIHTHCPFSSLLLAKHIRSMVKAPIILTYHTKFDIDIARRVKYKMATNTIVKGLAKFMTITDEVWTVSQGAGQSLRNIGYKGDYRIMPNGVDFPKGRIDQETVNKVTGSYDLPQGIPIYMFVGRIFKYKGLPLIIDALDRLNKSGRDFRMLFIGDGPDLKEIKKEVQEKGLDSKVIFLGKIMDRDVLRTWYTRGNLFLFPSTYDTNGIVVREAAACEVASVLIKDSCAAEGIISERNGFLIEENAESLFEMLYKIGDNLEMLNKVGINASNELYMSWEDAVGLARKNYQRVYEENLKKLAELASAQ